MGIRPGINPGRPEFISGRTQKLILVDLRGIAPLTFALQTRCSAAELQAHIQLKVCKVIKFIKGQIGRQLLYNFMNFVL